jgi:uncharacterized UBP type Zn finger protein
VQLVTSLEYFCTQLLNQKVPGQHSVALSDVLEMRAKGDQEKLNESLRNLHTVLTVGAGGDWIVKNQQHDCSEALALLLGKIQRESNGTLDVVGETFQDRSGRVCFK